MNSLHDLIDAIPLPDAAAERQARARLDRLTKPPGSLGVLEDLAARLAAITGQVCPPLDHPAVLVAAADHGVVAEGVSPYPQAVTGQMVRNFLRGGAAINALAGAAGAQVIVVDAGVAADLPALPELRRAAVMRGSGNLRREPAMSRAVAEQMLLAGARIVAEEADAGLDLLALGEMGIGNSTAAACLTSALTGAAPELTTGRGAGVDDAGLARKRAVVADALARACVSHADPLGALAELGGLEIALLAGAALAAASRRIPVVLDGYIATSAALAAAALAPRLPAYLIAGHRSAEPGHRLALEHLGLRPLLALDMRLGEGSGAALAIPIVRAASRVMREMATFEDAGVSARLM
ncbi:MAG TPA: nicotinate-nucleotide--dimethylbenzimidazole phosphoribosyltransferase [Roseiflexaceae bacterium]|nr:nicotinate-nucleotide--dimethylbenzimidazole phosphoribosyltransferase [Roseiflexaceae bacterium]